MGVLIVSTSEEKNVTCYLIVIFIDVIWVIAAQYKWGC